MKKIKNFLWEFARLILLPLVGFSLAVFSVGMFLGINFYPLSLWSTRACILGGFVAGWFLGQTVEKDGQGIHFKSI